MTTANREKVYACDYCGSDYTDAKYCCAARREYLNAHGKFETGRAPAASVGDAPSDAVAWELSYPREMPAYELVGAPEFVRSEAHAEKIAAGCESHYGKRATYRALSYTAPPAAPVVIDAVKWAQGLIKQLPRDHDGRNSWLLNYGIGEESDWLRAEYARHMAAWKEWREGMPQPEMRKYEPVVSEEASRSQFESWWAENFDSSINTKRSDGGYALNVTNIGWMAWQAALSVPATDDKAEPKLPELPEGFQILSSLQSGTDTVYRADQMIAYAKKAIAARLAAPTSPHDVDVDK